MDASMRIGQCLDRRHACVRYADAASRGCARACYEQLPSQGCRDNHRFSKQKKLINEFHVENVVHGVNVYVNPQKHKYLC